MLLQKNIGLNPESIGDASIERVILHRMDVVGVKDKSQYLARLISDQDELNELVEEVVVPETWFFRNLVPFDTLVKCLPQLTGDHGNTPIRILSIPCSTGEEPYSIAITLLKSGIPRGSFQIDAVDISKRALKKARRAIYGKHSFRESDGVADPAFFHSTRSGQQLSPVVKEHVNYIKGNIMKDMIAPEPEYYDIIFCRNLLIYFDRHTQKAVLDKIYTLLKKNGTLFMGHAETTEASRDLFVRLNVPRAFAYKKKTATELALVGQPVEKPIDKLEDIYKKLVDVTLKDIELSKKRSEPPFIKRKQPARNNRSTGKANFVNVEKLIEQGHLSAASTLCEQWQENEPEEAQVYYYLGLISSLEGNVGSADALLKKAIYLNPNHHKALGLSALLAEQRGDSDIAETLRFRESRARQRAR